MLFIIHFQLEPIYSVYILLHTIFCPLSWDCRMYQLHLCRGVKPFLSNKATCWLEWWLVILEIGILVDEQSVTWQLNWSYDLQHFTLALTGLDGSWRGPIWSISRSCQARPSNMIVLTLFFILLLWQTTTQPYFIFKVLEGSGWVSFVGWLGFMVYQPL